PAPAAVNSITMKVPYVITDGEVIDVPLELSGADGLHAISVGLTWNASVVTPIDIAPGDFVGSRGGVVLSPGPGRADAAMLGENRQLTGQGVLATAPFRA